MFASLLNIKQFDIDFNITLLSVVSKPKANVMR